jgi:hypothetical protein
VNYTAAVTAQAQILFHSSIGIHQLVVEIDDEKNDKFEKMNTQRENTDMNQLRLILHYFGVKQPSPA